MLIHREARVKSYAMTLKYPLPGRDLMSLQVPSCITDRN
ncbi:hypothetical protein SAMN05443245_6684 [Paraburkholderia fungorum]|uniref:Uncharacterized protein n=1 Tax=Paraburkholderia fungorum TaxID=134537 RepID=A0A1H1JM45_9BURK|nr:hypothetical protein SAMN05443245_6684 [Paraburkholderia fungorum]